MTSNPYQTLGISPDSTIQEARAAWLQRVRVLHPDRFDAVKQKAEWELATQMLQDVNAAWEEIRKSDSYGSNQAPPPLQKVSTPRATQMPTAPTETQRPAYSGLAITSFVLTLLGLLLLITGIGPLLFVGAIIAITSLLIYLWQTNLQQKVVADYLASPSASSDAATDKNVLANSSPATQTADSPAQIADKEAEPPPRPPYCVSASLPPSVVGDASPIVVLTVGAVACVGIAATNAATFFRVSEAT